MAIITDEAVILRAIKHGDTSKIITVYSKNNGKINCIVKGARNLKSKVLGVIEPFNHITIVFYNKQNRELQMLSKAETIKNFAAIKTDLDKLTVSYRILEMLNKAVYDKEHSHELFDLLLKIFAYIDDLSEEDESVCYLYFQIHLCRVLGISPIDFTGENINETGSYETREITISGNQSETIRHLFECEIAEIDRNHIKSETISDLMSIYDKYIAGHTENFFKLKSVNVFNQMI